MAKIFPIPQNEQYFNKTYASSLTAAGTLLEFYRDVKDGAPGLTMTQNALLTPEEYTLEIDDGGIAIAYATEEGKYRAITSLYMLVKTDGNALPCCKISDKPQFARRGYMLDISRCKMQKPETIKTLIDMLSLLKYNEFQLYMESFCFKYSAYPKYTEDFDCLTAEDIRELDAYCRERFIDLVPNQNCFGHMSHWLGQPEFSHLELTDGETKSSTLNPLLPESFEFVTNLFDSLLPHFSSKYVNVGMDEAYGLGKFQIAHLPKDEVFMDWLARVNDLTTKKYGKTPMFWSDMILNYENAYTQIPENAIALEWGYELIQSQVMAEHCMAYQRKGIKYYVCPSCNTHFSFTGRFDVTSFNLRTAGEVGRKYGAIGYLVTDWGMPGGGCPDFGVWGFLPGALAGQYAWNVGAEQNGETFKADYIRGAQAFLNQYIFGGKNIAEYLYRAANYYLLEPERVHVGTMCGEISQYPLDVTAYYTFFDLKNTPYDFYFDNIIGYMSKIIADLEEIDYDPTYKREMILNCKMVVLCADLCKVRIHQAVTAEHKDELIAMIDEIAPEFRELWCNRNYEKGVEVYLGVIARMKAQLPDFVK